MTQNVGFKLDGKFIPMSYDTNNDRKLQRSELNIWLKDNNCIYINKKIIDLNKPLPLITNSPSFEPYKFNYKKSFGLFANDFKFDGEVGVARQSHKTGDCWLLTGVNSLSGTSWGRQAIKDAIKPDNNGGVTVTFKGASCSQKEFNVTQHELIEARKSGEYTSGDPDMLAIELAAEKCYDLIILEGKAYHDSYYDDKYGSKSISACPMKLPNYEEYSIEELLTGSVTKEAYGNGDAKNNQFDIKLFKELDRNKDDYAIQVAFESIADLLGTRNEDEKIHGNHAYMVKSIDYGKTVTVVDPYNPDKDIVLDFNYFLEELSLLSITPNPDKKNNLSKYRIDSHEKCHEGKSKKRVIEEYLKRNEDYKMEMLERERKIKEQEEKIKKNEEERAAHYMFKISSLDPWYLNKYQQGSEKFNKDNILEVFDNHVTNGDTWRLEYQLKELISYKPYPLAFKYQRKVLDNMVKPIIAALTAAALEKNIDEDIIWEFSTKCYELVDKKICFKRDEKLSDELIKMYNLIKES